MAGKSSAISEESENKIKNHCDNLYLVLKHCNSEQEEDALKKLHCVSGLISQRKGSKLIRSQVTAVTYLCNHAILPAILMEILKECKNLKICSLTLDIIAKLMLKNTQVSESERKLIRRRFHDPHHFKTVLEAFQGLDEHFHENERTNASFYDMQVRFLKIVNCIYSRKGQTQISLLTLATIEFMMLHFTKYKMHREISKTMLPLIKILCRSRKYCSVFCNEQFLSALVSVAPVICNSTKSVNRKYLIIILYKITKTAYGAQLLSKDYIWLPLLEFFLKIEHQIEDLRQRPIFIKACTILHRGVRRQRISITPVPLHFNFNPEVQEYISECRNRLRDNDDSDNGEDTSYLKETHLEEVEEDFNEEHDDDSDDLSANDDNFNDYVKDFNANCTDLNFYSELMNAGDISRGHSFKDVYRHYVYDRQALPDKLEVGSDTEDGESILPARCNVIEEIARELRQLKGIDVDGEFPRRCVYDLDALVKDCSRIDVPDNLEVAHAKCTQLSDGSGGARKTGLVFESRFECGNLRKAEQIADNEYELWLSPDVNITSGLQWFYFQVSNTVANQPYIFNICNYTRTNSQFNYSMQPVIFSTLNYIQNGRGWKKTGEKILYYGNQYVNKETDKQFRSLRFSLYFPHSGDYCYIAYHFPYTYTRLMNKLRMFTFPSTHIYTRLDKLTQTISGMNDVPLFTITAGVNELGKSSLERRPLIFLTARVHPGESNASWIMEGILEFLLQSTDAHAVRAREKYVFKIIPMLNPEGVIYGNSRCGLTGNDLNRCWKHPHTFFHPEIDATKKLVAFATQQLHRDVFTFIDVHGHSRKKFFFFYGCNPAQSWCEQDGNRDALNFNMMADAFSADPRMKMSFCRNTIERKRESTCRVVMWREFAINSYTLECSFCSADNKKKITTQILQDIGRSLIVALAAQTQTID